VGGGGGDAGRNLAITSHAHLRRGVPPPPPAAACLEASRDGLEPCDGGTPPGGRGRKYPSLNRKNNIPGFGKKILGITNRLLSKTRVGTPPPMGWVSADPKKGSKIQPEKAQKIPKDREKNAILGKNCDESTPQGIIANRFHIGGQTKGLAFAHDQRPS